MKKKVAVLIQKGSLSKGLQENTSVSLFEMEGEKVKGVENIPLESTNEKQFLRLMSIKEVSMIYVDTISKDLIKLLSKLGIVTKCRNEISDDKFINQFIFV